MSQSVVSEAEPPQPEVNEPASLENALTPSWFSAKQVEEYGSLENEDALAKAIIDSDPGASREEVLFRYKLSRIVYLKNFELPMLPGSATQVMNLARDEHAGAKDYVRVIQTDPSLVSAIVRLSNSAMFSGTSECSNLDQSIVRIGLKEVEKIAMLHAFNTKLFRVPGHNELVASLVQRGVNVSFAAQGVARAIKLQGIEPFLAGLLHNVGKLIVLQTIGNVQKQLNWTAPMPLIESAFEAFQAPVGEILCRSWELSEDICEAVRWSHDAGKSAEKKIRQSVYLGIRICDVLSSFEPVPTDGSAIPEDIVEDIVEDQDYSTDSWIAGDTVMLAAGLDPERMELIRADVGGELGSFHGIGTTE